MSRENFIKGGTNPGKNRGMLNPRPRKERMVGRQETTGYRENNKVTKKPQRVNGRQFK